MKFSAVITPDSLCFVARDGVTYSYQESMSETVFKKACDLIRTIQKSTEEESEGLIDNLILLLTPTKIFSKIGNGRIVVENGQVFFDGVPIHNIVTENILWGLSEGFDVSHYISFLEKLQENPSRRALTELFSFIERNKLVIDEDGDIIAYKRIKQNYRDIHSGTIDNTPGVEPIKQPRNTVDDDWGVICSQGLHVCAFDYLNDFGSDQRETDRVILVKINPKDVVSIPDNVAKIRVCEYKVVKEIPYNFIERDHQSFVKDDFLSDKPVWTNSDIDNISYSDDIDVGDIVKCIVDNYRHFGIINGNEYTVTSVDNWAGRTFISLSDGNDSSKFHIEFNSKDFYIVEYDRLQEYDDYEDYSENDEE